MTEGIRTALRHSIVAAVSGAILHSAALAQTPATASPNRPNILFVLIDDMGFGDLGCYGASAARTPRIDQLAREGIRFTQFYVNAPICSPSRCALLTGQYPQRWSITSFINNRESNQARGMAQWLDPKSPTLARSLKDAGYATGHFGKWHLGGGRDVGDAPLITEYGFDKSLTQFEGLGDRLMGYFDRHDGSPPQRSDLCTMSERLGRGKIEWVDRSELTSRYADAAIDFIDESQKASRPFYVNVWLDDVHSPFWPPKDAARGKGKRAMYRAVVEAMDMQLAKLLDHLAQAPALRDNTIVILASDNGPEPGAGSAGPFRGAKSNLYEGGVREPFIVWAPGWIDPALAGTSNQTSVIAAMDLAPSLLEIAGVRTDAAFDGESKAGTLLGKEQAIRNSPIFWRRPPDRPGPKQNPFPDLSMRQGDWKLLCMFDGTSPQLYDLAADPGESTNLAVRMPDLVKSMADAVRAWNASMPADKPERPQATTQPAE